MKKTKLSPKKPKFILNDHGANLLSHDLASLKLVDLSQKTVVDLFMGLRSSDDDVGEAAASGGEMTCCHFDRASAASLLHRTRVQPKFYCCSSPHSTQCGPSQGTRTRRSKIDWRLLRVLLGR